MELNKIYFRDCLLGIKEIESNSIDIIIADPPYYNAIKEEWDNQWSSIKEYQDWCNKWIKECFRVLKPSGTMFIYGYEPQLAYISILLDLDKQRWLSWYYTNKTVPSLNFWQHSHESIICTWKEKPIFNKELIREPYTDKYVNNCSGRIRPSSNSARFGNKETTYNINKDGALPRDTIQISTLAGGASLKERIIYCKDCKRIINPTERKHHHLHKLLMHPTQKPRLLTEKLINSSKPDREYTVLIPFVGSGSELSVIKKLKGNYIGFESNKDYFELANSYLEFENSIKHQKHK